MWITLIIIVSLGISYIYVFSKLNISPHMHSSILTKIYQTLAPLTNFLFSQSPQNGATLHSQNFQHNEFLFMSANSLGFHLTLLTSHKL